MSPRKTIGLFLIFGFCSVSFLNTAKSDIINNGAPTAFWQLNSKNFSDYAAIPGTNGWVNLGNCGSLSFTAGMEIGHAFFRHTLTVWLKRDGVTVATESKQIGPSPFSESYTLNFPSQSFAPGQWTIQWQFLDSVTDSDSASIKLIAPIKNPQPPPYNAADFCGSAVSGNLCVFERTPPTGFIYNNSYYVTPTPTKSCALGQFDGANCLVMSAPASGFIYENRFYKKYDACSKGTNDSAHCYFGAVPGGTHTFVYQGALYYTYASGPNKCPLPGTTNDTANCYVGPTAVSFVWRGGLYMNYDSCSTGTNDSANCLLASAPSGTTAFEYQGRFYVTPTKTCSVGQQFDGANCFIRSPPSGTTAIAQGGNWYWTPRYCR
jgi:hypothetical protein